MGELLRRGQEWTPQESVSEKFIACAREAAQWLRLLLQRARVQFVAHTRRFITIRNSSTGGTLRPSSVFLWAPGMHTAHLHTHM